MKKTITTTKTQRIDVCDICESEVGPWNAGIELKIPNPTHLPSFLANNQYFVHDICAGKVIKEYLDKKQAPNP